MVGFLQRWHFEFSQQQQPTISFAITILTVDLSKQPADLTYAQSYMRIVSNKHCKMLRQMKNLNLTTLTNI